MSQNSRRFESFQRPSDVEKEKNKNIYYATKQTGLKFQVCSSFIAYLT
jgi:hypothetical protein